MAEEKGGVKEGSGLQKGLSMSRSPVPLMGILARLVRGTGIGSSSLLPELLA